MEHEIEDKILARNVHYQCKHAWHKSSNMLTRLHTYDGKLDSQCQSTWCLLCGSSCSFFSSLSALADDLMTSSSSFIKRILRMKWTRADSSSFSDKFPCFLLPSFTGMADANLEKDPKEGNPFLQMLVSWVACWWTEEVASSAVKKLPYYYAINTPKKRHYYNFTSFSALGVLDTPKRNRR